jgi:Phage capsid family
MSTTDYELKRSISDIQGKLSSLDHRILRMSASGPDIVRPGRAFFLMAEASLARYREHHAHAESLLQKAAVPPAMTGTPGWASELVASPVGQLLLWLATQSAYAALAARTQAFEIENEVLPRVVIGGEIAASFVAEGQPVGVNKTTLAVMSLAPRKILALAELSEELLEYGINVEAVIRQLLSNGISSALDVAFFGNAALTASTPQGILNGISATTASTATPPSEAARADLRALVAALTFPSDPVFVTSAARALYLRSLLGASDVVVLASSAVPAARVICVDAAGLIAAHAREPRFLTSRSAALHEDTTALPLSATGSPPTVAAPLRSLLQTNTVAIRAALFVAWSIRPGAVSYLDASW